MSCRSVGVAWVVVVVVVLFVMVVAWRGWLLIWCFAGWFVGLLVNWFVGLVGALTLIFCRAGRNNIQHRGSRRCGSFCVRCLKTCPSVSRFVSSTPHPHRLTWAFVLLCACLRAAFLWSFWSPPWTAQSCSPWTRHFLGDASMVKEGKGGGGGDMKGRCTS